MFARTRIALLAIAAILAGTAPAVAGTEDPVRLPPGPNPGPAAEATVQVGMSCTRSLAQVVCVIIPMYQEVVGVLQKATPQTTTPVGADVAPLVEAAKTFGGVMFDTYFKKIEPQSEELSPLEQLGLPRP